MLHTVRQWDRRIDSEIQIIHQPSKVSLLQLTKRCHHLIDQLTDNYKCVCERVVYVLKGWRIQPLLHENKHLTHKQQQSVPRRCIPLQTLLLDCFFEHERGPLCFSCVCLCFYILECHDDILIHKWLLWNVWIFRIWPCSPTFKNVLEVKSTESFILLSR